MHSRAVSFQGVILLRRRVSRTYLPFQMILYYPRKSLFCYFSGEGFINARITFDSILWPSEPPGPVCTLVYVFTCCFEALLNLLIIFHRSTYSLDGFMIRRIKLYSISFVLRFISVYLQKPVSASISKKQPITLDFAVGHLSAWAITMSSKRLSVSTWKKLRLWNHLCIFFRMFLAKKKTAWRMCVICGFADRC